MKDPLDNRVCIISAKKQNKNKIRVMKEKKKKK